MNKYFEEYLKNLEPFGGKDKALLKLEKLLLRNDEISNGIKDIMSYEYLYEDTEILKLFSDVCKNSKMSVEKKYEIMNLAIERLINTHKADELEFLLTEIVSHHGKLLPANDAMDLIGHSAACTLYFKVNGEDTSKHKSWSHIAGYGTIPEDNIQTKDNVQNNKTMDFINGLNFDRIKYSTNDVANMINYLTDLSTTNYAYKPIVRATSVNGLEKTKNDLNTAIFFKKFWEDNYQGIIKNFTPFDYLKKQSVKEQIIQDLNQNKK